MWLEEFRLRHSEAARRFLRRPLDLNRVQEELLQARIESTIKKSTLETLEKEMAYWTYEK